MINIKSKTKRRRTKRRRTKRRISRRNIINRKSQVWISDYAISLLLFIIAAMLAVKLIISNFSTDNTFEELKTDASKISEIFLSEGYPKDWDNMSVIRPGLLTAKRLNASKVFNAMNLSNTSYSAFKSKFNTPYEFLIIFEDPNKDMLEFGDFCAIGNPDVSINSTLVPVLDCHNPLFTIIDYDNLVMITRLALYDSKIIRMVIYVWY